MLVRGGSGAGPASPELARRMRWVLLVMLIAFGGLSGRLWCLQVLRGDTYRNQTFENVIHERYLPSIRGRILDRNGTPLADNRPAFNIYATPRAFNFEVATELDRLLGLSDEEMLKVAARIQAGLKRDSRQPVLILDDQTRTRAARVEQERYRLPDLEVRHEPYRTYPQGALAAHVLGYMSQMNAKEAARLTGVGYEPDDLVGRYGLESMWEEYLRGQKGKERFAMDARGHRLDEAIAAGLIHGDRIIEPVAGYSLVLTLDAQLQKLAEKAVAAYPAAAVAVVEVKSGRVLALVSKPAFDPNIMTGHLTKAEAKFLNDDPRKPFIDKTLRATYPPGSTFKFVTTLAALEDGLAVEEEPIACTGSYERSGTTFHCTASHGKLTLLEAIQHSCNIYFWTLSERIQLDRMAEVANQYGFGSRTGMGLNGDQPGRIPTRAWYEERTRFKVGYTINSATGQGDVEVTVMQMVMAYAALANGGTLYVPQLVDHVVRADGGTVIPWELQVKAQVDTPPEVVDVWKRGMWKVVNEQGGSAFPHATSQLMTIMGKTGTAEVRTRKQKKDEPQVRGWHPSASHAWFAGWAPMEDPEIAVVVLIEHGGSGGKVAGPVAKAIFEGWYTKVRNAPAPAPAAPVEPAAPGAPPALIPASPPPLLVSPATPAGEPDDDEPDPASAEPSEHEGEE